MLAVLSSHTSTNPTSLDASSRQDSKRAAKYDRKTNFLTKLFRMISSLGNLYINALREQSNVPSPSKQTTDGVCARETVHARNYSIIYKGDTAQGKMFGMLGLVGLITTRSGAPSFERYLFYYHEVDCESHPPY